MTRMVFTSCSLLLSAIAALACGPVVNVCDEGCEDDSSGSSEGSSSSTSSPSSTTVSSSSSTGPSTTTSADVTSTTAATTSDVSTDPSTDTSTGEPGPSVTPGDPSPCLTGGNILVLDGDLGKYVHPGSELLEDASWTFTASGEPLDDLQVEVNSSDGEDWWVVWFATNHVPAPLVVGEYPDAQRPPFEDPGHPGIDTYGNSMGCNRVAGLFEIHELEVVDGEVMVITATWERHCEEGPLALRGCMHWEG